MTELLKILSGYYAGWVTKEGAEGMLLEFPWPTGDMNEYAEKYSEKMIEIISSIAQPTSIWTSAKNSNLVLLLMNGRNRIKGILIITSTGTG